MKIVFSKVLQQLMKTHHLSITQLSNDTLIPKSTLSDWTNGRLPSSKNLIHLAKLSNYFRMTLSELLFGESEDKTRDEIVLISNFKEGNSNYRLTIEKINNSK